jgi:hypothetical protein
VVRITGYRAIKSKSQRNTARSVATGILTGILLFVGIAIGLGKFVRPESLLFVMVAILLYAACGFVLALIWPRQGWRMGLWLFVIWPPMLLFAAFLSADVPVNTRTELKDLLTYFVMFLAACIGGAVGSAIRSLGGGTEK